MARTQSNDVLLYMDGSSDIKLLTKSREIKSFISVAPLITTGIHVTNNNDIILGAMEKGTYTLTDTSCRTIIVFGENKKEKQSYQYNKRKQRLFTVPYRITGVNTDIVVIDCISKFDRRVVVLGKEGCVKWTYQGHPQINTEDKPFNPCYNHTLHVISVLTYKIMSDQWVIFPLSLDIDTRGQLWVGCSTYKGKGNDAKLHIVKL